MGKTLGLTICQYIVIHNELPWSIDLYIVGFYLIVINI